MTRGDALSQRQRTCIISGEVVGPHKNGGVGTHCYYLARFLSQELKQEVTFLYTGSIGSKDEPYWKNWFRRHLDVEFVWLRPPQTTGTVPAGLWCYHARIARQTYEWLRQQKFDVCHFQDMLGNGFRCFQAKRVGLAFENTVLTCTVHGCWEWVCEAMQSLPQAGMEELQTKYLERYSIENCDVLVSPSQHMLDWLDRNSIRTPPRKRLLPYLFDPGLRAAGFRPAVGHVIFFGRLEVRKGLLLFLETLLEMDRCGLFAERPLKVTFLGRPGYTPHGDGLASIRKYRTLYSASIQVSERTDLGQPEALNFLSEHNDALVVCPSLIDNSPYAVIESVQLGLNIIAANTGGIPELMTGKERLFEPNTKSLAEKIQAGLNHQLPPLAKKYDLQSATDLWTGFCQELAHNTSACPKEIPSPPTQVAVFAGAGETSAEFHQQVDVLAALKEPHITLVARDDLDSSLQKDLDECRIHRGWSPLRQKPEARLDLADTSSSAMQYAVLLSAGCKILPDALPRLVEALECSKAAALSCCVQINGTCDAEAGFVYEPLGPCLEGGLCNNYLGIGCVVLKWETLAQHPPAADALLRRDGLWAYLAGSALAGVHWDVFPEIAATLCGSPALFCSSGLDFASHKRVLESYTQKATPWFRRILLNHVAAERQLAVAQQTVFQQEQKLSQMSDAAPKKVLYKVKRETRRLISQLQDLCNRRASV